MRHGTRGRYAAGCRCDACSLVVNIYYRRRRQRSVRPWKATPGHLPVTCWCERAYVTVTAGEVRDGRTGSCGAPDCRAPCVIP